MRYVKVTLATLCLLIVIAIGAGSALWYYVDPNKIKPVLIAEAKNAGYELTIDDVLTWSFYPRLTIEVPHLMLQALGAARPFVEVTDLHMASELSQVWHRSNHFAGYVHAASLRVGNFHGQDVSSNLVWQGNELTLQSISGAAYGGHFQAVVNGSRFGEEPHWQWDLNMDHVRIESLLLDLAPATRIVVSGEGKITFQGNTFGKLHTDLYQHLDGGLDFGFNNGLIEGVDLNYVVRTVDALLNHDEIPKAQGSRQTAFNSFSGNVTIKEGVASSQDLMLISPAFITSGTGTLNLLDKQLALALQVKPQQDVRTQWEVPVNVTGTLSQPEVGLDKDEVAKFLARQELNKVKDTAKSFFQKIVH